MLPSVASEAQQQRQVAAQPTSPKPKHGPTPPPIACAAKRIVGLDAGQTGSFGFWARGQGQAEVQFTCKLDRTRIVVGLMHPSAGKDTPAKHAIHLLDLALDPPPSRLLHSNAVEAPVMIVRPGGGMSLVFGEAAIEKGLTHRTFRALDLVTGKVQTLFSLPVGPLGPGCAAAARAAGLDRVSISAGIAIVDVGDNGPYGVEIEHEVGDCKAGKTEKRFDTYVAVPDGFEEFK